MAVYVQEHSIGWYDAQHTEIQTTWRSPWYGTNNEDAFSHDLGIKEYHIIWSECTFLAGWTVVKEETVAAVHAGMPDYYRSTMTPTTGKGTVAVRARVAPIIDPDLSACTQADLYGNIFDPKWPDYHSAELQIGFMPPDITNVPTIEWLDKHKTAYKIIVSGYDPGFDTDDVWIHFQSMNKKGIIDSGFPPLRWNRTDGYIERFINGTFPGYGKMKYRARSFYGDGSYSTASWSRNWSPWSEEILMPPNQLAKITITAIPTYENPNLLKVVLEEETDSSNFTDHYEVEYTEKMEYFDSGYGTTVVTSTEDSNVLIINPGDEGGGSYYFRARIVNDSGSGDWLYSEGSTTVGKVPDAPTTWTYTNSFIGGVDRYITFFWTHNSKDGSTQRAAKINLTINGTTTMELDWPGVNYSAYSTYKEGDFVNYQNKIYKCIFDIDTPEAWNEDHWDYVGDGLESDEVYSYKFPVSNYGQGGVTTIKWFVKTRGVMETGGPDDDGFSKASTVREVKVYQKPTVTLVVPSTIESYPINIRCSSTPSFQNPISYIFSIKAKQSYDTMGFDGESVRIDENQIIYTKYGSFPDNQIRNPHDFYITLNAGDVHLENGIYYDIQMSIGFDSGLSAETYSSVYIDYDTSSTILPMANIYIDKQNYTALVSPIAYDLDEEFDEGNPILAENTLLSVYRKEYNGEMTLIQSNINNVRGVAIEDPHPSLKSSTYRIIAMNTENGKIDYNDIRSDGINDPCIVIQWDEDYRYIEGGDPVETPLENPLYQGTFLRLPYNIKLGESTNIDVSNIKYIGRKRPVSYFGTQLGETASWSCEFDKKDEETIYKLRKLAIYMGEVYVREPMGLGYWATIKVSFNRDYNSLIIPVTLEVTRVEGGGRS